MFDIGGEGMKPVLFRRADGILCIAGVLAAGIWLGVTRLNADAGAAVVVEAPGAAPVTYALDQPVCFEVAGKDGIRLTVEIAAGRVRVSHSDCPDGVCVSAGWLSRGGQTAVCVPAGVTLRVTGGRHAVDGVTA